MKTSIERIVQERQEQLGKHGLAVEHDVLVNNQSQLAYAASCMAYPHQLYPADESYIPDGWDKEQWGHMMEKSHEDRLVMAGALILAELDRLKLIKELDIRGRAEYMNKKPLPIWMTQHVQKQESRKTRLLRELKIIIQTLYWSSVCVLSILGLIKAAELLGLV